MAIIVNSTFNSLRPVELKYDYYRNETLQSRYIGYNEGITLFQINGLNNFQDVTINKGSCFVLTSTVCLSCIFTPPTTLKIGQIPGSIKLQTSSLSSQYILYSNENNTFINTQALSTDATNFFINIKNNSEAVEILVDNKYVKVDTNYPYTVRVGDKINDPNQIYRQEFFCEIYNNFIALKTHTNSGFRYLAVGNDGILRATGVILNSIIVNDYLFAIVGESRASTLTYNFNPNNNWITYFLNFPTQIYNKDVSLNKIFANLETNFLLDFPVNLATKNESVTFNLANLKTNFSPTGSPPQIDNSYEEQIITTN